MLIVGWSYARVEIESAENALCSVSGLRPSELVARFCRRTFRTDNTGVRTVPLETFASSIYTIQYNNTIITFVERYLRSVQER